MIDFNSQSLLSDRICFLVDAANGVREEPPRNYLGCSAIGGECERAVYYEYARASADTSQTRGCLGPTGRPTGAPSANVPARALRIFARGHALEAVAAGWLKRTGFVLLTEDPCTGGQFQVSFCGGRLKGHADGMICHWRGEGPCPVPLPCLWECKVLGHKYAMQARREGIGKSYPKYAAQTALYMEGLGLRHCLFTVVDADLMELYFELAGADPALSARMQERFLRVESAFMAGEAVPRGETKRTAVQCRMCRWAEACWEDKC